MKYILFVLTSLLLIGCATVGTPIKNEQLIKLEEGKTTQEEVIRVMGEPVDKTIIETGEEKWTYVYMRTKPTWSTFVPYVNMVESGANTNTQKLEILFDTQKIVKKHACSNSTTKVKTGLFQ